MEPSSVSVALPEALDRAVTVLFIEAPHWAHLSGPRVQDGNLVLSVLHQPGGSHELTKHKLTLVLFDNATIVPTSSGPGIGFITHGGHTLAMYHNRA